MTDAVLNAWEFQASRLLEHVIATSEGGVHIYSRSRVQIRSSLPGRHRVWIAGLYQNGALEHALAQALSSSSPQHSVRANLVTGTLLVVSEPTLERSALLERIESILTDFASRTGTSLTELEQRGHKRPVHLAWPEPAISAEQPRNGERRRPGFRFFNLLQKPEQDEHATNGHATNGHASKAHARNAHAQNAHAQNGHARNAHAQNAHAQNGHASAEHDPTAIEHQTRWHTLDSGGLVGIWHVDPAQGLDAGEATQRIERYGRNELPRALRRSGLAMFIDQFKGLPVLLLAGSAVLSCVTGGIADGAVILAVLVVNGVIGYVTESSAERTISSLTREGAIDAGVLRSGRMLTIPIGDLVPGDIIALRIGSVVPADARLIEASELNIDEAALTGESLPVTKTVPPIEDLDLPLGERTNMVYRGSLVTGGSGLAVVVATGATTEVGRLQSMLGEVQHPETPMQRQLRELGERTVVIAGIVCGGVFVLGLLRGYTLLQMLRTSVSLAVAAVPEGLPTVAITTLAIGISRMKSRQVIVRRLDAIETLGSVQVLCFDKTGTITHNRMRVVEVAAGERDLLVSGGRLQLEGQDVSPQDGAELEWLLRVGALCSEVTIERDAAGSPVCDGSATEKALVELALELGVPVEELRERYPRQSVVQRSEQRRLMATIHRAADASHYVVAVKGSPDDVLDRCQFVQRGGQILPLTEAERRSILRQNQGMSSDALRVLGMAYRQHEREPEAFDVDLIWLGLMGLADPPRDGLKELMAQFRAAGVRSVMITGDQSATAYAVAKQIGLDVDGELRTLDAVELDTMDPELLAELVPQTQVFSRVSPRHKLRIVQALQKAGLVVAMTGDGINDCPALKAADVGVAMGGGKSSVAREVADVILETDDLHAMLAAIEQGRVIHADIKKAVRFILATNLSEILLTLTSVAAGFGESLSPLQLLWINLVSDIFPELALALQPSEDDVLLRPPRERGSKMFSKQEFRHMAIEGSLLTAGALGVYSYAIKRYGLSAQARSMSFITLTAAQLLHAFSTRSERHNIFDSHKSAPNPYIPLSVGGGIVLTLLIQLIPATRRMFGSRPLPAADWLIASVGAAAPLVLNEVTKAVRYAPVRGQLTTGAEASTVPSSSVPGS